MSERVNSNYGRLFLIPTPLGKSSANNALPPAVVEQIRNITIFMVEQLPSAVTILNWLQHPKPSYELTFHQLNKHTSAKEMVSYLSDIKSGRDAGIISEAGAPGVADPGGKLVNMAHSQNIKVVPLVGPSSILLGLMASGFNGQSFCFHGYLPRESSKRCANIRTLEESSRKHNRTELFIETPHRNKELTEDIIRTCHPKTKFCACSNLSLPNQQIISKPIDWWQRHQQAIPDKEPTIFLLYAR